MSLHPGHFKRLHPIAQRADDALWRLPLWARRTVVVPFAVVYAITDFVTEGLRCGVPAARIAWRMSLSHVSSRPSRVVPHPVYGRDRDGRAVYIDPATEELHYAEPDWWGEARD